MASDLGGERSALDQAVEAWTEEREAQADLLAGMEAGETGALTAPSPLSAMHPLASMVAAKRRGRPPGAKSRRTEETTKWLLSTGRHPVAVMIEAYSLTPRELAQRIGIQAITDDVLMDLLKLQLRLAEAAAPYVAQRLPQAVQVDAKGSLTIGFSGVSLPARGASAGAGDGGELIEGQALGVCLPAQVGRVMSDDDENP